MTDDQIIEALGWPASRPDVHPRGLFMRVRAVVAAAQAEQTAKIEAMRAALVEARQCVNVTADAWAKLALKAGVQLDPATVALMAEYMRIAAMIDAALGDE